jgi:hypothetical protein
MLGKIAFVFTSPIFKKFSFELFMLKILDLPGNAVGKIKCMKWIDLFI